MPDPAQHPPFAGSLLDEPEPAPAPAPARPVPAPRSARLSAALRGAWSRRWVRRGAGAAALALLVWGAILLRPVPRPDYASDPMGEVLDFTLLTEEFNRLPVQERLDLLRQLIERVRTMSEEDSAAMAMFGASIRQKMREQVERNAALLAIDAWDQYAREYRSVPPEDRPRFLDRTFIEFQEMTEILAEGRARSVTDEERLEEGRAQARRDLDALRSGEGPGGGDLARMSKLMREDVGRFASPQQQVRSQQLMRDMTRHLREQDVETGRPLPAP